MKPMSKFGVYGSIFVLILGIFLNLVPNPNSEVSFASDFSSFFKDQSNKYIDSSLSEKEMKLVKKYEDSNKNLFSSIAKKNSVSIVSEAEKITAVEDKMTSEKFFVSYHKVEGAEIDDNSSMIIVYDTGGSVLSQQMITFANTEDGQIITSTIDNKEVFKAKTNLNGDFKEAIITKGNISEAMSPAELKGLSQWVSCINSKLSSMGVASWVIGVVSVGCGAICVVTAGAGCWACIGGVAAGYTAQISYALEVCKGK